MRSQLLGLVLALASSSAAAAESPAPEKSKQEVAPKATAPSISSAEARARHHGGAGGRLGAVSGGIGGIGGDLFAMPSSRLQLGGSLQLGSKDLVDDEEVDTFGVEVKEGNLSAFVALAQARLFVANSFSVVGGGGVRRVALMYRATDWTNDADEVESEAVYSSVVAMLGLGNVWSWESGFYIGADWLNVLIPLHSTKTSSSDSSGDPDSDLRDSQEKAETLAKESGYGVTAQALFTLGAMF